MIFIKLYYIIYNLNRELLFVFYICKGILIRVNVGEK